MKMHHPNRFLLLAAICLCTFGLMVACSSDSPSEPQQQPGPPPGTAPPSSGQFNITISANPGEIPLGGSEPATITIRVRRRDNGQAPPNGTTLAVSTNLGEFDSPGSGTQSGFAQLVGGNAQLLLYPGDAQGTALVQARLENSFAQVSVRILGSATFFLAAVQPNSGSPQGGDMVTITGGGFAEPVRVTFDGVVAQVRSVSSSSIRVVVPASTTPVPTGSTRSVEVAVTIRLNTEDEAGDSLAGGFIYAAGGGGTAQPRVFSVSPASGPNEGGTRVSINGEGFQAPVQVFFGAGNSPDNFDGVEAVVESVTATRIVVRSPAATGFGQANRNELVSILVRNVDSGFAAIASAAFRYGTQVIITAWSPTTIPYDSASLVTIQGQGFDEPVAVGLAGVAATPISVTGTEIVVRAGTPVVDQCENITGSVSVVNIETGDGAETDMDAFTYLVSSPVVTGLSPNSGTGNGNTTVTISGLNFDEPLRVFFGEKAATVVSVSPDGTSITVLTPSFSDFQEEACDDNADGTEGNRFVPTAVDVMVVNLVTDCEDMFTGGFTYTPSDVSCRGDLGEPPPPPTPQCSDGLDNDGDGFSDHASVNPINPDPECAGPNDDDESA